jgi:hypothetical protein
LAVARRRGRSGANQAVTPLNCTPEGVRLCRSDSPRHIDVDEAFNRDASSWRTHEKRISDDHASPNP